MWQKHMYQLHYTILSSHDKNVPKDLDFNPPQHQHSATVKKTVRSNMKRRLFLDQTVLTAAATCSCSLAQTWKQFSMKAIHVDQTTKVEYMPRNSPLVFGSNKNFLILLSSIVPTKIL